ncbi:MAG: helix-turn-helix domain-containing protein [Deltaproteobacteria bacterium]|nr:helix-turn-helix domain-containing protein [Deltaproteobacteria bacterium]
MDNENLLTVKEAAAVLRVSPATLRGWIFRDKIDYVKINGSVRFKRSDLYRMIESCTRRRNTSQQIEAR